MPGNFWADDISCDASTHPNCQRTLDHTYNTHLYAYCNYKERNTKTGFEESLATVWWPKLANHKTTKLNIMLDPVKTWIVGLRVKHLDRSCPNTPAQLSWACSTSSPPGKHQVGPGGVRPQYSMTRSHFH